MAALLRVSIKYGADHDIISQILDFGGKEVALAKDDNDNNALHISCEVKRPNCIGKLLDVGGKKLALAKDKYGCTALFDLLYEMDINGPACMKQMLDIGGKELALAKNKNGCTALFDLFNDMDINGPDCVQQMLDVGGTELALAKDNKGCTALHFWCQNGPLDCIDKLLDVGGKELALAKNDDGYTALQIICNDNEFNCIDKLLNVGGKELALTKNDDGNTALHIICNDEKFDFKKLNCINKLLTVGGRELALSRDKDGNSALHIFFKKNIVRSYMFIRMILDGETEILNHTEEIKEEAFISLLANHAIRWIRTDKDIFCQHKSKTMENLKNELARVENQLEAEKNRGQLEADTAKYRYGQILKDVALLEDVTESQKKDLIGLKKMIATLETEKDESISKVDELKSALNKHELANQQLHDTTKSQKKGIEEQEATSLGTATSVIDFEGKSCLEQELKSQKKVIEQREQDNYALREENERMKKKLKSLSKRTRGEYSNIDCVLEEDEDNVNSILQTKRSRYENVPKNSVTTSGSIAQVETLERENEDLLKQLQQEKAYHLSTLRRLDTARNELKRK